MTVGRRDVLKGAAPIVAFLALESIGGAGIAAGGRPAATRLSDGVIFPDDFLISMRKKNTEGTDHQKDICRYVF